MDKRKLVNIILKDLEEVRILAEEVAESEEASLIEIELAFNRAKLLIQEIELLRELAGGQAFAHDSFAEDKEQENELEENEEAINYPEPELEITNYKEDELPEEEELPEIEEDFDEEIEADEENEEPEGFEEEEEGDKDIVEDEVDEDEPLEIDEDELDEDDWVEEEEELEEEKEEPAFEEVKAQPASTAQATELNNTPGSGFREISIDDDEDDIQPIRVSPSATTNTRPPMREIPKPEDAIMEDPEKAVVSEKFHKERTLNETLGENKAVDSKLTNGPITSLKSTIGLNDRFLFIREIFDNNSAKYNEIIDNLDKMNQIQEAVEYLRANLSMQKNEASMKFVELLKRRFSK